MSIRHIWVPGGLLRTFEGELGRKDLIISNQSICNDERFTDLKYMINDFSKVKKLHTTVKQVEMYYGTFSAVPHTQHQLKIALVSFDHALAGILASYCTFMKGASLQGQVFATVEEAYNNCVHCLTQKVA